MNVKYLLKYLGTLRYAVLAPILQECGQSSWPIWFSVPPRKRSPIQTSLQQTFFSSVAETSSLNSIMASEKYSVDGEHITDQPVEAASSSSSSNPPQVAAREHEHDIDSHEVQAPTAAEGPLSSSPAQQQQQPSPPMFNTPEGRVAAYRRMLRVNNLEPEQRPNLEALVRYYEEGGKVPGHRKRCWPSTAV